MRKNGSLAVFFSSCCETRSNSLESAGVSLFPGERLLRGLSPCPIVINVSSAFSNPGAGVRRVPANNRGNGLSNLYVSSVYSNRRAGLPARAVASHLARGPLQKEEQSNDGGSGCFFKCGRQQASGIALISAANAVIKDPRARRNAARNN